MGGEGKHTRKDVTLEGRHRVGTEGHLGGEDEKKQDAKGPHVDAGASIRGILDTDLIYQHEKPRLSFTSGERRSAHLALLSGTKNMISFSPVKEDALHTHVLISGIRNIISLSPVKEGALYTYALISAMKGINSLSHVEEGVLHKHTL